jgi:hypothetical protein
MEKVRLSIRDRAFGHSPLSNGPIPPVVSGSDLIEWDRESPAVVETIYTDAEIFTAPAGVRVWLLEPIHGRPDAYEFLLKRAPEFREVWTHDRELLSLIPNGRFIPFGGCWIAPEDRRIWPKTKGISTIVSNKRGSEAYEMRHEAVRRFTQIDAYGVNYTPLAHKIDGLRDYRFQLVIENVRADWWFTEKLIDCFMTGTIPIYWGCPDIGKFFNKDGMFWFKNLNEVEYLLKHDFLSTDCYDRRINAIRDNFERAKAYCLAEDYIARNLLTPVAKNPN